MSLEMRSEYHEMSCQTHAGISFSVSGLASLGYLLGADRQNRDRAGRNTVNKLKADRYLNLGDRSPHR